VAAAIVEVIALGASAHRRTQKQEPGSETPYRYFRSYALIEAQKPSAVLAFITSATDASGLSADQTPGAMATAFLAGSRNTAQCPWTVRSALLFAVIGAAVLAVVPR
jgi:hypothetical protein